jgi:flagellin-like protein
MEIFAVPAGWVGKPMYINSEARTRGVAPVVGVILMVGITVLLAATAAYFVTDLGQSQADPPTASFSFDYDASGASESLTITHTSGDTLGSEELLVVLADAEMPTATDPNGEYTFATLSSTVSAGSTVGAGDQAVVETSGVMGSGTLGLGDATVSLVWRSPGGSSSVTLGSWP